MNTAKTTTMIAAALVTVPAVIDTSARISRAEAEPSSWAVTITAVWSGATRPAAAAA
jgi:hypothetical protein